MKKILTGVVLAAAVVAGAYLYLFRDDSAAIYRTAKVERGDIVDTITATGNINAVTTVSVGSQISGTIRDLLVDYNSRVRKGQVIARIDPRLLEAAVLQAQGRLRKRQGRPREGESHRERTPAGHTRGTWSSLKDGFVAQSDVDAAQTAYDQALATQKSAEASVMQATGSLKVAQTNLENATIRSPVDGIVISRSVDVGQTVAASFQTPTLFSIAQDLTKMQIDTNVDESDIGRAAKGQAASFTVDAWPDKTFTGVVSQVRNAPIITQNVVTYNVVILVDNRELLLKPGMTTNVTIQVKKYENILKIPNPALRYRPSEKTKGNGSREVSKPREAGTQRLYRLGKGGKPAPVSVKTGVTNGLFTELIGGDLKEGDDLIVGEASKQASTSNSRGWSHRDKHEGIPVTVGATTIEIRRITKTYRLGDVTVDALKGVDLSIASGEFVAVMGPSGSGKSTLMNILGCLDRPTSGSYLLDGQEIGTLSRDGRAVIRRNKLGFVFQGFNLLPRLSALENVELPMVYDGTPGSIRREKALSALSSVGLADRAHHLPNQLSGGQQQRVAIARAIVNTPSLLLADEPTGNLDTATSDEIMGIFQRFNDDLGITLVLVTHENDIAQFARRVIRFRDGTLVEDALVPNRRTTPSPGRTAE